MKKNKDCLKNDEKDDSNIKFLNKNLLKIVYRFLNIKSVNNDGLEVLNFF